MDLTPSRTAVIAVHLQHDIVAADGAFGGFFAAQAAERDVIGQAGQLLEAARRSGAAAVYTRVAWQPGYPDLVANSPLLGMVAQFGALVEGSGKAEIVPQPTPADGDVVLTHQRVGGFSASQLDVILRSRGIDTVLFAVLVLGRAGLRVHRDRDCRLCFRFGHADERPRRVQEGWAWCAE